MNGCAASFVSRCLPSSPFLSLSLVTPALVLTEDTVVVFVSARYRAAFLTLEKKEKKETLIVRSWHFAESLPRNLGEIRGADASLAHASHRRVQYDPVLRGAPEVVISQVNIRLYRNEADDVIHWTYTSHAHTQKKKKKGPSAFVLHLGDNRPCSPKYTVGAPEA